LTDPNVVSRLNLTPEQGARLATFAAKQNEKMSTLYNGLYSTDPQGAIRQMEQLRQQNDEFFSTLLNAQQMQSWRQMAGEPYRFSSEWHFKK
jgi:hypothetical protein